MSWLSLLMARRGTMVKSILQAIPNYCISIFLIPTTLGEEIQRMMNSYWWGSTSRESGSRNGLASLGQIMCLKGAWGLRLSKYLCFQLNHVRKTRVEIYIKTQCLSTRAFKSKYFLKGDFMGVDLGNNPTYSWQSILFSKSDIEGGCEVEGIKQGEW